MFFKKNKPESKPTGDAGDQSAEAAVVAAPAVRRDPKKAISFFRHAETVADARNYDYAIELYINGLRHDPDNMPKHEALHEVALRRKVAGGKPPGFAEKLNFGAKDKIEKFLHAEMLWMKDPLNLNRLLTAMEKATDAYHDQDEFNLGEVGLWIGVLILEKNQADRPLTKDHLIKLRDQFKRIGDFERAVQANVRAMEMDPENTDLQEENRDLEAEVTMQKGNYNEDKAEKVDFRNSIRDKDQQTALGQEDQLSKSDQAIDEIIARRREDFAKRPDDVAVREQLVKALLDRHSDETENESMKLLQEVFEKEQNYKHRVMMGDIRMRQLGRRLKAFQAAYEADKTNEEAKANYLQLAKQKLKFEIQEFTDRIKHYPTEMKWRFELGKRWMQGRKVDNAIEHLQAAVRDPKFRDTGYHMLGQCYHAKGWFEEAVTALRNALEAHRDQNDRLGLEIRYMLMDSLVKLGEQEKNVDHVREAQKVGSEVLQVDFNFRDIRTKVDEIRATVRKLQQGG